MKEKLESHDELCSILAEKSNKEMKTFLVKLRQLFMIL